MCRTVSADENLLALILTFLQSLPFGRSEASKKRKRIGSGRTEEETRGQGTR